MNSEQNNNLTALLTKVNNAAVTYLNAQIEIHKIITSENFQAEDDKTMLRIHTLRVTMAEAKEAEHDANILYQKALATYQGY